MEFYGFQIKNILTIFMGARQTDYLKDWQKVKLLESYDWQKFSFFENSATYTDFEPMHWTNLLLVVAKETPLLMNIQYVSFI